MSRFYACHRPVSSGIGRATRIDESFCLIETVMRFVLSILVKAAEQPNYYDDWDRDPDQPKQQSSSHGALPCFTGHLSVWPLVLINVMSEAKFHRDIAIAQQWRRDWKTSINDSTDVGKRTVLAVARRSRHAEFGIKRFA
jgi:hypothetical protein